MEENKQKQKNKQKSNFFIDKNKKNDYNNTVARRSYPLLT